eukprot:CAMPEP_0178960818 /NCGR_PEP_ID=MMETSP0789-20121207/13207_1 /TAXON_ID=3005 /ORGANISM="Rhizosolenia setigera, Strain CCMP 1694" /LENGTH=740 /DNA_ID=CAMNT_0020644273 /DNA_START=46 /DNA_END=2268 /DNA_ORIENTATION=+
MSSQVWTDSFLNLQSSVESNNYKKCASSALKILNNSTATNETIPDDVKIYLSSIYIRSLLKSGLYRTAHDYCVSSPERSHYALEEAYALYRLKRYKESQSLCDKAIQKLQETGDVEKRTMLGYRLHQTSNAIKTYDKINLSYESNSEEKVEISANVLACQQSTYDNFSPTLSGDLSVYENSQNYDVDYNMGTFLAMSSTNRHDSLKAEKLLRAALDNCLTELKEDGASDEEIFDEMLPIQTNLAYALLMNDKTQEADQILKQIMEKANVPDIKANASLMSVKTSAINNLAVRKVGKESLFDSLKRFPSDHSAKANEDNVIKFTPNMMRSILHNNAVLLMKMGKESEFNGLLERISNGNVFEEKEENVKPNNTKSSKKKLAKKMKSKQENEENFEASKARCDLLQVEFLRSKGEVNKAQELLDIIVERLKKDEVQDNSLLATQALLYKSQLEGTESLLKTIEAIQDNKDSPIHSKPALVATLVSMYQDLNQTENLSNVLSMIEREVLESDSTRSKMSLGEYYLHLGMYEKAADIFSTVMEYLEENSETDIEKDECLAMLVVALSYFDEEQAEERSAGFAYTSDSETNVILSGEELEISPIPWTTSGNVRRNMNQSKRGGSNAHQKKSKNHECVLRQRAKKREAYLQKLQEEGKYNPAKPTKPDPERWIPKKERSHFKGRRKNRRFGAGTSHQGISNTAGAAELEKKLDARARASGATETGASTAHISVSGSGGKKGRRGRR